MKKLVIIGLVLCMLLSNMIPAYAKASNNLSGISVSSNNENEFIAIRIAVILLENSIF